MSAIGLIRFDVEDYLTPASHDAVQNILNAMHDIGIAGSYGIVGKKASALQQGGYRSILDALAHETALGFHSWSHSEHPTIAEQLESLPYGDAVEAFVAREAQGVKIVADAIKMPTYFTQPGANWVPAAIEALPTLGMDIFFSDAWNSYIVPLAEPHWLGKVLHLSPPVMTPKPFLLKFPDNWSLALEKLDEATQEYRNNQVFMIMAHPTELVTTKFWDAVNFAHGATTDHLRPAPLRSRSEQAHTMEAFRQYLAAAKSHPDIEWTNVTDLKKRLKPLGAVTVDPFRWQRVILQALGPVIEDDASLSAAQQIYLLAAMAAKPSLPKTVTIPVVMPPENWEPSEEEFSIHESVSAQVVRTAALWIVQYIDRQGRLPSGVPWGASGEDIPIEVFAQYASDLIQKPSALTARRRTMVLQFLQFVQDPARLHWDWPIFPENFQPFGLWRQTRALAWSFSWAMWR
jgi:hypothetical protein